MSPEKTTPHRYQPPFPRNAPEADWRCASMGQVIREAATVKLGGTLYSYASGHPHLVLDGPGQLVETRHVLVDRGAG